MRKKLYLNMRKADMRSLPRLTFHSMSKTESNSTLRTGSRRSPHVALEALAASASMDRQRRKGLLQTPLPCTEALMVLPGNCGSSVTLATLQDARFTHGNLLRSYTLSTKDHKEKFREQTRYHRIKQNKIPGDKPIREAKALHSEEADETEDDTSRWRNQPPS